MRGYPVHIKSLYGSGRTTFRAVGLPSGTDFFLLGAQQKTVLSGIRLTTDSGAGRAVFFQYGGSSTSMLNEFSDLHISNFQNGAAVEANNLELSEFVGIYVYQCAQGIVSDNTGNTLGMTGSCVSNEIRKTRVFGCTGAGIKITNWGSSELSRVQALQNGKTGGTTALGVATAGVAGQIEIAGSCHNIDVVQPDIEEYVDLVGTGRVYQHLVNGISIAGFSNNLFGGNFVGNKYPWIAQSATDFCVLSPKIIESLHNGLADAGSTRVVAINPRQLTSNAGITTTVGGGSVGYAYGPAAMAMSGGTLGVPSMTSNQIAAITYSDNTRHIVHNSTTGDLLMLWSGGSAKLN